jgi:hypothetical protein
MQVQQSQEETFRQFIQSQEEILRVADDWFRNFCPPNVVKDGSGGTKNAELIMGDCLQRHGALTISGMTESVHALAAQGKVAIIPAPTQPKMKTAEELAQEEIVRQNRDYLDSLKPQPDFNEKMREVQRKKDKEKAAKVQKDAEGELAVAISGYQCYRVNGAGIDYSATEMVQKELRDVVSRNANGKRDYVRNLAVVRQIITELPDHPKMGDVARGIESLNARSIKLDQRKDSFGEDVREVGKLGGLR